MAVGAGPVDLSSQTARLCQSIANALHAVKHHEDVDSRVENLGHEVNDLRDFLEALGELLCSHEVQGSELSQRNLST